MPNTHSKRVPGSDEAGLCRSFSHRLPLFFWTRLGLSSMKSSFTGEAAGKVFGWTGPNVQVLNRRTSQRTGISEDILWNFNKSKQLSINQRKQWMTGRITTEDEDMVYG